VIFEAINAPGTGGGSYIFGVNATNGNTLWTFKPSTPVWNIMAMFPGDDTFLFQDYDAKAYRLGLFNGSLLWQAGGGHMPQDTWSDGGAMIGPNGIVYAASSKAHIMSHHPTCGGGVHAYRISNGSTVWEKDLLRPFFTWAVVGQLPGKKGLSVIVSIGANAFIAWKAILYGSVVYLIPTLLIWTALIMSGLTVCRCCQGGGFKGLVYRICRWWLILGPVGLLLACGSTVLYAQRFPPFESEVIAMDAETGEQQWEFKLPSWPFISAAGDSEGFFERMRYLPQRSLVLPAAFNSPTIDGDGRVIIGYHNGRVYSVRDDDGDGVISKAETMEYDTKSNFLHTGAAFAPGVFAVASTDTLFVWLS